jgi:hypothetical protein
MPFHRHNWLEDLFENISPVRFPIIRPSFPVFRETRTTRATIVPKAAGVRGAGKHATATGLDSMGRRICAGLAHCQGRQSDDFPQGIHTRADERMPTMGGD